jgi:hypothetical protein
MVAPARRVEFHPARLDEVGQPRCWRCGTRIGLGILGPGTWFEHVCRCNAGNVLTACTPVDRTDRCSYSPK